MRSDFARLQMLVALVRPRRLPLWLAAGVFLIVGATALTARADEGQTLIGSLGDQVIAVLKQDSGPSERRQELQSILHDYFDMPEIARLVLGRHWRRADEAQRERYIELFAQYVVAVYSGQFGTYGGQRFSVVQSRPVDEADTMVTAEIRGNDGIPVVLHFRLHPTERGPRIVDVSVEGVSMLITMREEFSSVVTREGIDGLLRRLEAKTRSA